MKHSAGGTFLICLLFLSGLSRVLAQTASTEPAYVSVPRSYRAFYLGMGIEELRQALASDPYLVYTDQPDVSMSALWEKLLLECEGRSFIRRAFFQIDQGLVISMSFDLNGALLDYFSVYSSLKSKYGEPPRLSPMEAVWQSESTRVALERPLTIKYLDRAAFDAFLSSARAEEEGLALQRKEFLDEF